MSKTKKLSSQMMRAIGGTMIVAMPSLSCVSTQAATKNAIYYTWYPSATKMTPQSINPGSTWACGYGGYLFEYCNGNTFYIPNSQDNHKNYVTEVNDIKALYNRNIQASQKKYGQKSQRVKKAKGIWNVAQKQEDGKIQVKYVSSKNNYVHAEYYQGGYQKMTVHADGTIDLALNQKSK